MTEDYSSSASPGTGRPKDLRPAELDAVDHAILRRLEADARITNNALAEAVGVAPSTCLMRVRALRAAGVIRGFHADIDPAAMGRDLQAMVSVRLQAGSRGQLAAFSRELAARPEVLDVFFLAGLDDFLVHVAVPDTAALRAFVLDQLTERPEVATTQTSLVFEHLSSRG